jgi:hypothetical protein
MHAECGGIRGKWVRRASRLEKQDRIALLLSLSHTTLAVALANLPRQYLGQ